MVVKAMTVMAWTDGYIDEKEARAIRKLAERMALDAQGRAAVEGYLRSRPSMSGLAFDGLSDKERDALMLAAVHFAYLDGQVQPAEREVLVKFAESLGVSEDKVLQMEQEVVQRHKKSGPTE
jgi:uncharacterized tellurite resistance protein B-like protein